MVYPQKNDTSVVINCPLSSFGIELLYLVVYLHAQQIYTCYHSKKKKKIRLRTDPKRLGGTEMMEH